MEIAWALGCLALFLGLYAILQRRSGGPVRWGWLVAVIVCAAVALAVGLA